MFNWEPINTTNLISLVQLIVVICGFYFSWKSLEATRKNVELATANAEAQRKSMELATANAQAQLYNQMAVQGRDLQYKFMDTYYGGSTEADLKARQDLYTGTVISYYSACHGMRGILSMPQSVTKLLDDELKQLMRQPAVKRKWEQIKENFSKEFIDYVNKLQGV